MKLWNSPPPPIHQKELSHYGVLGMKWGVKKDQNTLNRLTGRINQTRQNEKAYRDKLSKAVNRYNRSTANVRSQSDAKRMAYRNQSLAARTGKTAATMVAQKLIGDIMTGKISQYQYMSRNQIMKELTSLTAKTAMNVAINDALAKSASKNYDENGKLKRGVSTKTWVTKEDLIQQGITTAAMAIPVAKWAAQTKFSQIVKERQANEARFNAWGSRILSDKVDNVIWQSDDLKTAIIDNRGR